MSERRGAGTLVVCSALVFAGCATAGSTGGGDEEGPAIEDCVSEEGQRLLTFCASPEVAEFAERQYNVGRSATPEDERAEDMVPLPVEGAPVRGERDAPITVHLFSDLSCEDCRVAYRRLSAEVESRPGEMRMVFRHLPGDQRAANLSRAAVAAGEQGMFWEFVDELYARERLPAPERWADVADEAGLDVEQWREDRRSPTLDAVLERDAIQAEEVGVAEAPTYFVNGIRKIGGVALREFDEVVAGEIEAVDSMREAGLEGAAISWRRILTNYEPVDWEEVDEAGDELQNELPVDHVPVGTSPSRGAPVEESRVTVVVFADFLCRYSAESARVLDQLVETYGDRGLRVVFKHFPLRTNRGSDRVAAASVVARQGGVFWDFHDELFFGEVGADVDELESTLRELGWTDGDFEELVTTPQVREVVEEDRRLGREVGVEGTPTIFVNGVRLEGVWSVEELAPLIEDQLELGASIADLTGKEGEELYFDIVEANRGR